VLMGTVRKGLRPLYSKIFSMRVSVSPLYTMAPPLARRIPNVVYQTWKSPLVSLRHAWEILRFRRTNHDYSFRFFDDRQLHEYMNRNFAGQPILEVFNDLQIPASRADVWRYCVLFREGGIYCDIDSALKIPFRELLRDDPAEMISFEGGLWSGERGWDLVTYADPQVFLAAPPASVWPKLECPKNTVLNWLICFEPAHPILEEVISLIVRHAAFFRDKMFESLIYAVTHFTGPPALTQAVWRYMEKTGKRPAQFGVDFRGQGIFKLPGEEHRYTVSPHYSALAPSVILRSRSSG
jgi:inositol phosphorylceramide mannosyltransferase catalytic subunit